MAGRCPGWSALPPANSVIAKAHPVSGSERSQEGRCPGHNPCPASATKTAGPLGELLLMPTLRRWWCEPENKACSDQLLLGRAVLTLYSRDLAAVGCARSTRSYQDKLVVLLYRHVRRFTRQGTTLADSALGDWTSASSDLLVPLYDTLTVEARESGRSGLRYVARYRRDGGGDNLPDRSGSYDHRVSHPPHGHRLRRGRVRRLRGDHHV